LLAGLYGLGADQTLEFEVITTDGEVLTASPDENSELYRALSGGVSANLLCGRLLLKTDILIQRAQEHMR
jgi:FAD/FMN-containing dehydrogenase